MRKTVLYLIIAFISGMLAVACDDTQDYRVDTRSGSSLRVNGELKTSYFTLSNSTFMAPESVQAVITMLSPVDGGERREYETMCTVRNGNMECGMNLPANDNIPDGEYYLTMRMYNGEHLGGRLKVLFKDEMLHVVSEEAVSYMGLKGLGTVDDPYLIGTSGDFSSLLVNLQRDPQCGAGRHFRQTATFEAPPRGSDADGRGWFSVPFAGEYDGGGFTISNLFYVGASDPEKDKEIGLFASLLNGAEIHHLTLSGVSLTKISVDGGILAGTAAGTVVLRDIKVEGTIGGDTDHCGALVGRLNGSLTVENFDLQATVKGRSCVGGVVGKVDNGVLTVKKMTTADRKFLLVGNENVGGVAGDLSGTFNFSDIKLMHTVSAEDGDVNIIQGNGGSCVGGLVGIVRHVSSASAVSAVEMMCPVGGGAGKGVGGFFGMLLLDGGLTVSGCSMTSIVSGGDEIGGFAGYCEIKGGGSLTFDGTDDATRVIVDHNAAGVRGNSSVGGFFGKIKGSLTMKTRVRIAANVSGTGQSVGGFVGEAHSLSLDLSRVAFTSSTMKISGGDRTGGFIGYSDDGCTLTDSNHFDYAENGKGVQVPPSSRFVSRFNGEVSGKTFIGGVVGYMRSSEASGVSVGCTVTGSMHTGGIAGYASGSKFRDVTFFGTVRGKECTGGIAGKIDYAASLQDCINYGTVGGDNYTGGIAGNIDVSHHTQDFSWCVNTGDIKGAGNVGGVIGCISGETGMNQNFHDLANYGTVDSSGGHDTAVGGIIGNLKCTHVSVVACANHGPVHSSGEVHGIGGILGSSGRDPGGLSNSINYNPAVYHCCNKGTISCDNSTSRVGGIVGYLEEGTREHLASSIIYDCYNMGDIPTKSNSNNGGILGYADIFSTVKYCVNFGLVSHGNGTIGTHKTGQLNHEYLYMYNDGVSQTWCSDGYVTDDNRSHKSTYGGFDFNKVWDMVNGWPVLRDCPFQSVTFKP